MNEDYVIPTTDLGDMTLCALYEITLQENTKLQSQIDEVKELTSKYDLSNIKCDCNCLRNFIGNLEQILSKLEEVGK